MIDIFSFCLGAAVALILALLVVMVVVLFRLSRKLSQHDGSLQTFDRRDNDFERFLNDQTSALGCDIDALNTKVDSVLADACSYTDKRVDKVLKQ